jgi:hypothetical protein
VASIERRIEVLEAAYAGPAASGTGEREKLVSDFARRALDAMASIRRAPIDAERWRYGVEKLRGESPMTVLAHVAALSALEHEDEEEARELLAGMERERGLDRARHERLLEVFARIVEGARDGA